MFFYFPEILVIFFSVVNNASSIFSVIFVGQFCTSFYNFFAILVALAVVVVLLMVIMFVVVIITVLLAEAAIVV